ncbi:TetR/AcrR family transcriptional regulator [Actinomadura kijaniata]|uniref:TetR/AcrR family transcriptional regulator n=1 Tax=Actinomadura kijaniata TaxID=46161 RepID=UPI00082B2BF6|nr:TetR/AcrR family transcriptional regulator [Actinomadura kijaniata]
MSTSDDAPLSVWLRPEKPPRDRRLTRDRIVGRTVEILDSEGHRGLSMRRVATDLGVTAGSLYWYVTTKDELLELALDAVLGEVLADLRAAPVSGWREGLGHLARSTRAMMLRHPWVVSDLTAQPNLGPNALALAETGLAVLSRAGFAERDLDAALAAVNDQVTGAVAAEITWRTVTARAAARWPGEAGDFLAGLHRDHPHLARRMAAATGVDVDAECDRRFTFALDCLLDGLALRLAEGDGSDAPDGAPRET